MTTETPATIRTEKSFSEYSESIQREVYECYCAYACYRREQGKSTKRWADLTDSEKLTELQSVRGG